MKKFLIGLTLAAMTLTLSACKEEEKTGKAAQSQKAREAANSINFVENAEIDNIKARLELTSNPGLIGYVVLFNDMGQPVMYTGVKGKITSGSKRLTEPDRKFDAGQSYGIRQSASDEGTYGSSGEYIFFWTTEGQYIQWNGRYLYSEKPFRLKVDPIVLTVAGAKDDK